MAIQWLRLWHEMPNDPKWRTIARVSGQPITAVLSVYLHLLVAASANAVERGRTDSVCVEDVASALDLEPENIERIISAMQGRVLDGDQIAGWEKRQVEREDGSAARAKAWRETQKALKQTQPNAVERKRTPDKDKDKDIKPKPTSSSGDDGGGPVKPFDRFWEAWPNKVAKAEAQKAWAKIKPDAELVDVILAAIEAQKQGDHWRRDDGQYIGHPATWLRGGRWLDVVRPYVEPTAKPNRGAWWTSKESMEAFGLTLDPPLKPNPGEFPRDFAARINAVLDRIDSGKPAPIALPTPYTPPMPSGGEEVLTLEQRQARLAEMRAQTGIRKRTDANE